MAKSIRIFKSFEEQELFFLQYFARLSPSERLQALTRIQDTKKNNLKEPVKKITVHKHFVYGY